MYPMSGWHTPWMLECIDKALRGNAKIRVRLQFIRPVFIDAAGHIREDIIRTITVYESNILEGSVSIEATATAPTRNLTLSFMDENDEYDLGSVDGTTYLSPEKMIQVYYEIHVPEFYPENGGFVWFPVFRGHISRLEKRQSEVQIQALSKDARYMEPCLHSPELGKNKQLWAGHRVTDAIRYILGVKGEQMYRIPNYPERLRNDLLIKWNDVPWAVCQKIAQAHNMSLYFDGMGACVMKRFDNTTVHYELDGQMLTDFPTRSLDFTELRNLVVFLGHKPEKGTQVRAVARNQNHPLDQQYIKQWKVEIVENSNVKKTSMAQTLADRVLKEKQQSAFTLQANSLVVPYLEEYDMIRVRDPIKYGLPGYPYGGQVNVFKLGQMTLPLDNKTPMTINRTYPFSYKLKSYYKKGRNPYR
jgi:hypothetical protein